MIVTCVTCDGNPVPCQTCEGQGWRTAPTHDTMWCNLHSQLAETCPHFHYGAERCTEANHVAITIHEKDARLCHA